MEILSPVGNKSSLIAAVRSGADAVYFGVENFNARRNAENFKTSDLKEISSYCHIRGVKAYLTLNTVISDNEFKEALNVVKSACEAGVDAIIINDLGLANEIKKAAPNMQLHASTQMTVHNIDGVKYLKEKGFSRVVLARENSLKQIEEISNYANEQNIELEIFVQGAHCMSVSGQCLLSSVLGGRSGNRGLCAQPCRLPFKVKNGNGYDLSLKDMNLFHYFDEFKRLKIASLKIEGRMKSEEYVAAATFAAKSFKDNSPCKEETLEILKNVFSRSGTTDGYLNENINKLMFGIRSEQDIENSKQIKNSIHEIYRREYQNVAVNMSACFKSDEPSRLIVKDGKFEVIVEDSTPEKAINLPTLKNDVIEKLSKTGSTPYKPISIDVEIDDDLFIPNKLISSLKEQAFEQLSKMRGKINPIPFYYDEKTLCEKNFSSKTEYFILLNNLSQLPSKHNGEIFFIPFSSEINKVEELIKIGYTLGIKTPAFFENLDDNKLAEFRKIGIEFALAQNIGSYNKLKKHGYIVTAAHTLNMFNSYSVNNSPADYCCLSVELTQSQIENIKTDKPIGIYAYGKLPLMLLKNCPIKSNNGCKNCDHIITDRKNIEFKIYCEDGIAKLINNRPIYLADKKKFINSLDFVILDFTDEISTEVEKIISDYENLSNIESNSAYTRGLYFKGVL